MAADDMEVVLELTPLGHGEEENHRVILLNKDKKEVEIGRASKNPNKGLLTGPDNAWFDYPILSRAHAKFTVSLLQKIMFVQDCNSTHGTYLQKRKLDSGIEYRVNDGELVTFGQQVTSGTVTYPAKDFRVHLAWTSRPSAPFARIFSEGSRPTFQVPDDDDNDSSNSSREGSVQVLDSHPRSFSVPSTNSESDSDESEVESIEIASSVRGDQEQGSAPTTPDQVSAEKEPASVNVEAKSDEVLPKDKTRGLNLKGPSIVNLLSRPAVSSPVATGSSQQNAIDIEDEDPYDHSVLDIESDDEGPEHLPIDRISASKEQSPTWEEPPLSRPQYTIPTVADEETDLDNEDQLKRIVLETQARVGKGKAKEVKQPSPPPLPFGSTVGASDGFDSADDDDGFDVDDDFGYCSEDDLAYDLNAPTNLAPNKSLKGPNPDAAPQLEKPSVTDSNVGSGADSSSAFKSGHPNLSISDSVNVSQNPFKEHSPQQRAPSPSDAALAKNSLDMLPNSMAFDIYPNNMAHSNHTQIGNSHYINPNGFDNVPFGYQYMPPISYPGLGNADTHSKPYNQGPFTNRFFEESPTQQPHSYTYCDALGNTHEKYLRKTAGLEFPRQHDIAADARYAAKLQAEEDAYGYPAFDRRPMLYKSRKGSEAQSSKINIANLVNDSHVEDLRPLKRKAGEMSTAFEAEYAVDAVGIANPMEPPSNPPTRSALASRTDEPQETQLPDAQTRDSLLPVETISLTQESTGEPAGKSSPTSLATDVAEAEGPARKKARMSASSPKGIGKFASGKFVSGACCFLAGAFAAFVATIPPGVQEETLRELGNVI